MMDDRAAGQSGTSAEANSGLTATQRTQHRVRVLQSVCSLDDARATPLRHYIASESLHVQLLSANHITSDFPGESHAGERGGERGVAEGTSPQPARGVSACWSALVGLVPRPAFNTQMPILLLGTLAALPWLATLGLRLSVIFDPPAKGTSSHPLGTPTGENEGALVGRSLSWMAHALPRGLVVSGVNTLNYAEERHAIPCISLKRVDT